MPLASLAETLIEMLLITLTVAPSPGEIVTVGAAALAVTTLFFAPNPEIAINPGIGAILGISVPNSMKWL